MTCALQFIVVVVAYAALLFAPVWLRECVKLSAALSAMLAGLLFVAICALMPQDHGRSTWSYLIRGDVGALSFVAGVFAIVSITIALGMRRGERERDASREDATVQFTLQPGAEIRRRIAEALATRGVRIEDEGPWLVVDARDFRLRIVFMPHGIECLHEPGRRLRQDPGFTAADVRHVIRETIERDTAVIDPVWRDGTRDS